VIAGRGVEIDAVEDFLDPTIRKLMPDPFTVTAMEAAAARIADAAVRGEKVAIFGDYDVDGATSAALLAWHLRHCGLDPLIHIPDRLFEGYGPNTEAVRALAGNVSKAAAPSRRDAMAATPPLTQIPKQPPQQSEDGAQTVPAP